MASDAERAAAYRARKRGGPPRELAPCGTRSAYVRHLRNGEDACDACKKANTDYQRDNKRKLRAASLRLNATCCDRNLTPCSKP